MTPFAPSNFAQTFRNSQWFVIHHTDCGMTLFTDEIRVSLSKVSTASVDENGWKNVSEEAVLKKQIIFLF
jgi:hypothetical protein